MRPNYRTGANTKLLPTDARAHNRTLVLHTIRRAPDISRAELSRITGLSRITVSELVSGLTGDGLVIESGARESAGRPGKPPTMLRINPDAYSIIAVDLSQPLLFRGSLLSLDGRLRWTAEVDGAVQGEGAVTAVINLIAQLVSASSAPIAGIGIGSPGIIDHAGTVVESTNLGWRHLALSSVVERRFQAPTVVENDANAAISAEIEADSTSDLFLVRIGAGLGGAAFVNGDLVRGANNAGGELGHVTSPAANAEPETVEESVQELLRLVQRSGDGEPEATGAESADIHRRIGTLLGESIAPAVAMLDVPEVVVEGPHGVDLALIAEAAETAMNRQRRLVFGRRCLVRPGTHGDDVVIRGMADIVLARALATL